VRQSSDRTFGLVFTVFFAIIASLPLLSGGPLRRWALWVSAAFLVISFVAPRVLRPLNRLWTLVGLVLHRVTNPLVLGILFYGVFTPFGVVRRMFGWDPLRLAPQPDASSYWLVRQPPGPPPASMKRQF
jgi:hypothetical protein